MNFMDPARQQSSGGAAAGASNSNTCSGTSPSSSSSSSSHHQYQYLQACHLVPPAPYHHQPRPPWDDMMRSQGYNNSSINTAGGANSQHQLHLMMMDCSNSSPITPNEDVHEVDASDLLLLGSTSTSTSSSSRMMVIEREHMFDKVVTPSDVGKLNRLVIPKQHAEKYFPLDSSTNEKGLLLNFEDRNGKPWRFRYSYWNSSQSYVMTKGWSRFVKEKKLDAGDIVSFQRGVGDLAKDRLFIDWRRRPDAPDIHNLPPSFISTTSGLLPPPHHYHHQYSNFHHQHPPWNHHNFYSLQQQQSQYSQLLHLNNAASAATGVGIINPHTLSSSTNYGYGNVITGNPCSAGSIIYLRSAAARPNSQLPIGLGIGSHAQLLQREGGGGCGMGVNERGSEEGTVIESVPLNYVQAGKAAGKRLRLFGVNMDCPISEEEVKGISNSCRHHDQLQVLPSTALVPAAHSTILQSSHQLNPGPGYVFCSTSPDPDPNPQQQLRRMPNSENSSSSSSSKAKSSSMSLDLDI